MQNTLAPIHISQRPVRIGGEGFVCPFEAGRVGGVVGIETDMGGLADNVLRCHPVPDHGQLGRTIAVFAVDFGRDALANRRGFGRNRVGAKQSRDL